MPRRPYAYAVKQEGYSEYSEVVRHKKQAMEAVRDGAWLGRTIVITPLFAGKPVVVKGRRTEWSP